jgi:REP element-mobilizing transposase RayT
LFGEGFFSTKQEKGVKEKGVKSSFDDTFQACYRHLMSRPLRFEFPGAWYHVMNRGRRRENIFDDAEDYRAFIDLLKSTSEMFRLDIAACCLMSNHYHLLLKTPEANLSRAMRHLGGVYTQWFNRRHGLDGQIFRGRYKAILVGEDEYLLGLVRYIHHNPLKAGVVKSLDDYHWSSHHAYLGRGKPWEWVSTGHVLAQFSDDPARARAQYRRFMAEDDDEHIERVFSLKKLPAILGSQKFVQSIKDRFFASKLSAEVPQSRSLAPVSMESIVSAVCSVCGVPPESLASSARGVTNEARDIAIYLARSLRGDSLNVIGAYFGIEKYSTVGSAVSRVRGWIERDASLDRRVEAIKKEVLSQAGEVA